jgi:hypothetical protein
MNTHNLQDLTQKTNAKRVKMIWKCKFHHSIMAYETQNTRSSLPFSYCTVFDSDLKNLRSESETFAMKAFWRERVELIAAEKRKSSVEIST